MRGVNGLHAVWHREPTWGEVLFRVRSAARARLSFVWHTEYAICQILHRVRFGVELTTCSEHLGTDHPRR